MSTAYPIRFADQLRQHLKGLRKKHGITQAKLGQLLGVSQARIAEIEANPGLVNLDQLLQVLSALGAALSLEELEAGITDPDLSSATSARSPQRPDPLLRGTQQADSMLAGQGESGNGTLAGAPPRRGKIKPKRSGQGYPEHDSTLPSEPHFTLRPKKGSW